MSHQSQLEKSKYRNWVRGGLAYKYLKEGIAGFADDVVQKEHTRILGIVNSTSRIACNHCSFRTLQPLHISKKDHTGRKRCLWDISNCNCLYPKKTPCPNKVCDFIMEEILKSHGSTPPAPNWKNTDIHKWYTSPWEIAKCFINAPGYADKTSATDIDASGLLHVFINNKNLHTHLLCNMSANNIFKKCRERRNDLFHSPVMELECSELTKCIDDIIAILEDPKELAATADAQQAVLKLKQLKQQNVIITTHSEAEVCRDALAYITNKTVELNQMIQEAKDDIDRKHADASKAIDDKLKTDLEDALKDNSDINLLKKSVEILFRIVDNIKGDMRQMKKHLEEIDKVIGELKAVKDLHMEKLKYIEQIQVLQDGLVELYQRHYVKTSLSPLKQQVNDVNIDEVYVLPQMMVVKANKQQTDNKESETGEQVEKVIYGYHDLFQSDGRENKVIYILGDAGAGKSSYCKMMIQDWCKAVKKNSDKNATTQISSGSTKDRNIEELKKIDFLFCLSFKRMKGFSNITEMIKAVIKAADLTTADFIDRIFEQDSDRCLILADGLDEWTPPNTPSVLPHVSYGLPERGITKNATLVTFSRPSAKGILNLTRSECDLRVKLTGISKNDVEDLIKKYLSKNNDTDSLLAENKDKLFHTSMSRIQALNLQHLASCPLLLQQVVWLYCHGYKIGKSHCDVYCHILNCMLSWSEHRGENLGNDYNKAANTKQVQFPKSLRNFESFIKQKRYVLILGQVAFESLTAEKSSSTFSRSSFFENDYSETDIGKLIELGILVEEKCFDPTHEDTQLSFIHLSYLEFFAAVYVSCQFDEQQSDTNASVLTEIFQNCKTAADILQLSNLLKMICGLCPFVITQVSHFISHIVKSDEKLKRQNIDELLLGSSLRQIQKLIFSFLSECDTSVRNDTEVYLADVFLDDCRNMNEHRSIIPDNVISFYLLGNEGTLNSMTQLKHLQYLNIIKFSISHYEMTKLCSYIQEVPLRYILLNAVLCRQQKDCRGHSIDLSQHDHLQKLEISRCNRITISNINTDNLETIKLNCTKTLNIGLLKNSRCLTELHLSQTYNRQADYVVHTLHQLQKLTIASEYRVIIVDENALTVTPEMRNLNHITLHHVEMSLETWRTFVDSLLTLQQSVQVNTRYSLSAGSDFDYLEENKKYVEEKENIEIIQYRTITIGTGVSIVNFYFRTRKQ